MSQLEWSATTEADVPALVRLGTACLERDGGLPDLTDPDHLRTSLVPEWRGRRLGAHLVVRTLTAVAHREEEAWLAVGCDTPARTLYERLGFRSRGTRALYEERVPVARMWAQTRPIQLQEES